MAATVIPYSIAALNTPGSSPHLLAMPDYTWFTSQDPPRRGNLEELSLHDAALVEDITAVADARQQEVRLCAASCYAGRAWSHAIRWSPQNPLPFVAPVLRLDAAKYKPARSYREGLFSIANICDTLSRFIFPHPTLNPSGLVVVSGETNCCKSLITRGLVFNYLSDPRPWKRKPHLLTIEDPIEKYFFDFPNDVNELNTRPIDYTPRVLKTDVRNLATALMADALRQTPTIVYVGETRDKPDWKTLLDFASTGHLIITTTHAGSLTETMDRIMNAVKARTPARRAELANRIVALTHLRRISVEVGKLATAAIVPALWRATQQGIHAFVSDGLSAVLPGSSEGESRDSDFGRSWFCKEVEALLRWDTEPNYRDSKLSKSWKKALKKVKMEALRVDLEGM